MKAIYTSFVCKPATLKNVVDETDWYNARFSCDNCVYIAAEHHLSRKEWAAFTAHFREPQDWIQNFVDQGHPCLCRAYPCIRVTGDGSEIALLVDPQGSNYARYVALDDRNCELPDTQQQPAVSPSDCRSREAHSYQIKEERTMKSTSEVSLKLTQKELELLHNALTDYRGKLGDLTRQMTSMQLDTAEAQALANQLGDLSQRMCDLMIE